MKRLITILLMFTFGISNTAGSVFASPQVSATLTQAPQEESSVSNSEDLDGPELIRKAIEEAPNPAVLGVTEDDTATPSPQLLSEQNAPSAQISSPPIIRKLFKKTFRANEGVEVIVDNVRSEKITIKLFYNGEEVENFEDFVEDGGTRKTAIIKPRAHFKPGKYSVEVTVGGQTLKQDFTWGVLAINTNKSIYLPNETAKLAMAVLDEGGKMICNADLKLEIRNPKLETEILSTDNGKIISNPDCLKREVRQNPDYETNYEIGSHLGKYEMKLVAQTKNGTYSITDSFEVASSVPFDIERATATRIYPPNEYPVDLLITANQDFQGTITEFVPGSFVVENAEGTDYKFDQIQSVTEEASQGVLGVTTGQISLPFSEEEPISLEFGQPLEHPSLKKLYKAFNLSGHDGVDFSVPIGTPILAVDEGEVVLAGDGAYGTTVVIKHEWGKSYYGHLSEVQVEVGETVEEGEQIALSGNSGISTGPHLHFSVKLNGHNARNGYFGKTDPLPILGIQSSLDPENQLKLITWRVTLKKGEKIKLSYTYKAPDISPEFYKLGPVRLYSSSEQSESRSVEGESRSGFLTSSNIKIFEESRQWQIAVDVDSTVVLDANGDGTCGSGCWTVPSDWTNVNTIYVIGGGGAGDNSSTTVGVGGGGGGAFSSITNNADLTPGAEVSFNVGAGGTDGVQPGNTWFCKATTNCANFTDTNVIVSAAGGTTATGVTGGAGGGLTGVSADFAGGAGGTGDTAGTDSAGGGGGAGSPNGTGGAGGVGDGNAGGDEASGAGGGSGCDSIGTSNDGGSGGPNGGTGGDSCFASGGTSQNGANGNPGTNGSGGAGGDESTNGGDGGGGVGASDPSLAGGGGGGGDDDVGTGGNGGLYGGGGGGGATVGTGGGGVIVIVYTQASLGPTLEQIMRHGKWWNSSGVKQAFTF